MKIVWTLVKHEIAKVIKSKKMLFSIFVMPVMVMGISLALTGMQLEEPEHAEEYKLKFFNTVIEEGDVETGTVVLKLQNGSKEEYEAFLENKTLAQDEVYVEFTDKGANLYYNSMDALVKSLIPNIKTYVLYPYMEAIYTANAGVVVEAIPTEFVDTSDDMAKQNMSIAFMLPYLLMIILFMNLVSVVGDTVAGEKERGILAKQVLCPISGKQLIYGKLIGSTIIGVFSSVIYLAVMALGDVVSMEMTGNSMMGLSNADLGIGQIIAMLVGFVFLSLVLVAAIILAGCFARKMEEATAMSMVVYYIIIVAAVASAFQVGEAPITSYMIPIYNFSLFMNNVLVGTATMVNGLVTVASLLVTFAVLVTVGVVSFKGERAIN